MAANNDADADEPTPSLLDAPQPALLDALLRADPGNTALFLIGDHGAPAEARRRRTSDSGMFSALHGGSDPRIA